MPNPTREERIAEVEAVNRYAAHRGGRVRKVQDSEDDYGTDGEIEVDGTIEYVEVRRKGYPNHNGKSSNLGGAWDNSKLKIHGIFLNESTIRKYNNKDPFTFLVDIKDGGWRAAKIDQKQIDILLRQDHYTQESTNSGVNQSVKKVDLKLFTDHLN